MLTADYIIVGSGLTGATIARLLADHGREVIVLERRCHVGGNVHDSRHFSGIRIHTYGPHYFRTGSERIWSFVTRFSNFYSYEAKLLTYVDGNFQNWPIQARYLENLVGTRWHPAFNDEPRNFEEAALSLMPSAVYESFVKGYTEKQWGVPASALGADLAKRFDVRMDNDPRLSQHKYQGLPVAGYAAWTANLLRDIPVLLNTDYLLDPLSFRARKLLVFTGPIDEFFGFRHGKLKYRGQKRIHRYFANLKQRLPGVQVNYPDHQSGPHIRTIEWKHLMPPEERERITGTLTTDEIPFTPLDSNDYEYPFPDQANRFLYQIYSKEIANNNKLLICGRLGEYRYLDMDQAIGKAMSIANKIIEKSLALTI